MIQEVMHSLVKLIRGALLPLSLREGDGRQYGGWEVQAELSGQWLAHVIQTIRQVWARGSHAHGKGSVGLHAFVCCSGF
jgi:hypothetical protein